MEEYEPAIEDYTRVIALDPGDLRALYSRGTFLMRVGRYENAIEDLSAIIELDPDNFGGYTDRGFAHTLVGDFER